MSKFRQHFFVCTNARPPFAKPSCGPQNSNQILMLLQAEVEKRGLLNEVKITGCDCLGPCEEGPIMVVYPEGTWYKKVTTDDVSEIVETHIMQSNPVSRLIYKWQDET
ncbi:(2Fe-2S) ferredoxin domain-containing protein [candidate division KSB1 bacterium]|nr:(2Fe-2S) ferredoxin domain-containing protein [candidate division KSB1 bacterium]